MTPHLRAWWTLQTPYAQRCYRTGGAVVCASLAVALYVLLVPDLYAVFGLGVGAYTALVMRDAGALLLESLSPASRADRRRAHRMARAAGVPLRDNAP